MKFSLTFFNNIKKINLTGYNLFYLYLLFVFIILIINFIFSYLYTVKFPNIVGDNNQFILENVGFNFGQIMKNLELGNGLKATYFGIDYYVSRMPLLPLVLHFLYNHVSENFYVILFVKNIFFFSIIFFILVNLTIKNKFLFLLISLMIFLYNPHNLITTLSINFEEGILNYLIIILFLLFYSEFKYRNIYIGLIIASIFFLKSSMIFLCTGLSIFFLINDHKKRIFNYFPIMIFLISSLSWGIYSYQKTKVFAYGTNLVSYNSFTLNHAYNEKFNSIYPEISPDTLTKEIENKLPKNIFKDEWEINDYYFKDSINYLKLNPYEVFLSVLKKIQVIFIYLNKDSQFLDQNNQLINELRISNIPNKILFITFTFLIIKNFIYQRSSKNIFMILLVLLYFFPYMVGFIYTRHCTSLYMIASFYLFYEYIYIKKKLDFFKKK